MPWWDAFFSLSAAGFSTRCRTAGGGAGKAGQNELDKKFSEQAKRVKNRQHSITAAGLPPEAVVKTRGFTLSKIDCEFRGKRFSFSVPAMFALAFVVGVIGGIYGIGGFAGMYIGARLQKFVPQKFIKLMLGIMIVSLALKYITQYFVKESLSRFSNYTPHRTMLAYSFSSNSPYFNPLLPGFIGTLPLLHRGHVSGA